MNTTTEAEAISLANELTEDSRRAGTHVPESPQNTGIVGVINPTPDIVTFVNTDGVAVLTIRHDGRIEIPADIDPSEAGRLAAEMMGAQLATMIRAAVAALTDALATIGERMPGLASLTFTAGGVSTTWTPKPPPPPPPPSTCPHCGAPKP